MRGRVVVPAPRALATTRRRAVTGAVGLTALAIVLTVPAAATAAAQGTAGVALPGLAAVAAAWLLPRRHAVVVTVVAVCGIAASVLVSSLPVAEGIAAVLGPIVVAGLADVAATREVAARVAAKRSALVGRVAAIATSGEELRTVLDGILVELARAGLRGGSIALINERDELFIAAYDGVLDESVLRLRMPVGVGIMGKVAASGRPALVSDLDRPAGGPEPANRTVGSNAAIRSIAVVPIRAEGKVVGVLEIDSTEVGRFDADDLVLLEQIALAISGAVQQAGPLRLANELLQRRVAELLALQETARTLAASLERDVVLRSVAASIASGLGAPVALVVQIAPEGATTLVVCEAGVTSLAPSSLPLDAVPDLCDAVASGEVRSLATPPAAPRLAALVTRHHLRSALVAPVRTARGFTGALVACAGDDRGFDPAQAQLLGGIAHLAGLAIANADAYRRLAEAAVTDTLTGLPNLVEFERRLGEAHRTDFSVIAVDVDNLKQVNDGYGHEAGDVVLQRIAATLDSVVGGRGTVARTGGDEFAIVLPGISGTDAVVMAQRMRETMHGVAVPYGLARISAGSASGPAGADAREVWWAAEEALYRAKQWGRDRIEVARATAAALQSPLRRWDTLVNELLAAHGVEAVFQPVVRLSDRRVVAHEALARPAGADAGMDVEGLFSAAHRIGLARDLDWLCRRAAFDAGRTIPAGVPLFVNVGVWGLLDPLHDVDQMLLLLRWAGRSPRDVVLEITEREVISDLHRFEEVLTAYRAEGFRFAIDDVGEGHSTLEVLAAGAPEYVKIARSLVCGMDRVGALAAVRAVVAFARETGAEVIAEGIERESDVDALTALGVDLGQGWHLGRPARVTASIEVTGTASRPTPPAAAGPPSVMTSPGRPPTRAF